MYILLFSKRIKLEFIKKEGKKLTLLKSIAKLNQKNKLCIKIYKYLAD